MPEKTSIIKRLFFILFSTITGGLLGLLISGFIMPKNIGWDGFDVIIGGAFTGFAVGMLAGIIFMNRLNKKTLNILLVVLGVPALVAVFAVWRESYLNKKRAQENYEYYQSLKPTAAAEPISNGNDNLGFGPGVVKPKWDDIKTLYFYGSNLENETSWDSVTFAPESPGELRINTAPPWLAPLHLKEDYQVFYFRCIAQKANHFRIVGNESTESTAWVKKDQCELIPWPEFLLGVFSVEPDDWTNNPIRSRPQRHSEPYTQFNREHILRPVQITDEWIEVEIFDQTMKEIGSGWFRWRSENDLILAYSLFS